MRFGPRHKCQGTALAVPYSPLSPVFLSDSEGAYRDRGGVEGSRESTSIMQHQGVLSKSLQQHAAIAFPVLPKNRGGSTADWRVDEKPMQITRPTQPKALIVLHASNLRLYSP